MTITLRLSDEDERRLAERAVKSGRDLPSYVKLLIERDIRIPASIDEILSPMRRQFEESGMTEDGLDELVEEAREEVWREKQSRVSQEGLLPICPRW